MTLRTLPLRLFALALLVLALVATTAGAAQKTLPPLTKLAAGEKWYLILLQDEPTGFLHLTTKPGAEGYTFEAESSVKISVMGFTREASARETYSVDHNLTLRNFHVEQTIDKSRFVIDGERTAEGLRVTIKDGSGSREKKVKAKGNVYPAAATNIFPLMKGFAAGKKYTLQVLDTEEAKLKNVTVRAVGMEKIDGREVLHMTNDLYPVSNDVWVDAEGTTIRESVRDDFVVTRLEKRETVLAFMSEAAIARRDLIYDFSLIRVEPPLAKPARKSALTVEFSRYPQDAALPEGPGQQSRREGDTVTVEIKRTSPPESDKGTPGEPKEYLGPAERMPADHPEIATLAKKIVGDEKDGVRKAELITKWVATNISGSVTDSRSPLETLKERNGNCQAHSRLYTSLARAAGVPTRFVSGLVYAEGQGFLYHSWAESFLNDVWVPVDPTFGQLPADATHIRIAEGDSTDEMAKIAPLIGKLRAKIVSSSEAQ